MPMAQLLVAIPVASVVVVHTLSTKSSASAVSASAKWHTAVNFLASQKQAGNFFNPTTTK
jgi:hypothetical protein